VQILRAVPHRSAQRCDRVRGKRARVAGLYPRACGQSWAVAISWLGARAPVAAVKMKGETDGAGHVAQVGALADGTRYVGGRRLEELLLDRHLQE